MLFNYTTLTALGSGDAARKRWMAAGSVITAAAAVFMGVGGGRT